jgi:hypothetical protein
MYLVIPSNVIFNNVRVKVVDIDHGRMNSVAMWIEKDNVKVWLNKDMPSQNYKINNKDLTYDQNGADTYNIQSNQIQSGVDNCDVLLMCCCSQTRFYSTQFVLNSQFSFTLTQTQTHKHSLTHIHILL